MGDLVITAMHKFHYWDHQARGQQVRFTLVQGGIDFEDVTEAFVPPNTAVKEYWRGLGGNLTTNIPMIEDPDGKTYTQSSAALRYAARKGGLYPVDPEAAYTVDNMIAAVDDFRNQALPVSAPILLRDDRTHMILLLQVVKSHGFG